MVDPPVGGYFDDYVCTLQKLMSFSFQLKKVSFDLIRFCNLRVFFSSRFF